MPSTAGPEYIHHGMLSPLKNTVARTWAKKLSEE